MHLCSKPLARNETVCEVFVKVRFQELRRYHKFANLFFILLIVGKLKVLDIRLAVLRGIHKLCCAHQLALFLVSLHSRQCS